MQFDQRLAHSERDHGLGRSGLDTFLAVGADQLHVDLLGLREGLEQRAEVELGQRPGWRR
jgi:hypothetical protein